LLATREPIFFSTTVTGLQRRRFPIRDFGIEPERIELAVKRRAPDVQPPRDFGHLTAVMAYRESDGLGFDIRKRAHMALSIEQRECRGGRRDRGCCKRRVESTIRMRSRMASPWNRGPNEALSPIRPKRGVKIAAVVSTSTGLILLAISSIARRRLWRLRAGPVDPRRSRAISIIYAPGHGRFLLTTSRNHLSFATCYARTSKTRRRSTSAQVPAQVPSPEPPRRAAGMEPRRPLCRDRRSAGQARPRSRRRRKPGVRGGLQRQARGARGATRGGIGAGRGSEALRGAR